MNNLTLPTLELKIAQNSNKVPGKPFKSKKELGGEIDPRINKGGRPKAIYEATAKYLKQIDEETGKTNAELMVESMGAAAQTFVFPHSVSAFKELRQIAEPIGADKGTIGDIKNLSLTVIGILQRAAKKREEVLDTEFEKVES